MFIKKPTKVWPKYVLVLVGLFVSHYIGFARGALQMESLMQNAVASAWEDGFEKGLEDQAWKDLASKHQKFSDKLCSAWWFEIGRAHV